MYEYLQLGRCNLYPAPGSYENCAVEFGPTADVTCLSGTGGEPRKPPEILDATRMEAVASCDAVLISFGAASLQVGKFQEL